MTEVVAASSPRRLSALATLLAACALSIIFVLLVPLRVGECGPPDPYLLRYLGSPFFHSTGYGVASSLEATIWVVPFLANVAVLAAIILAAKTLFPARLFGARPFGSARLDWIVLVVSCGLIGSSAWIVVEAHNVIWTLAGPEVSPVSCTIRLDPFTDTSAWVREPTT